MAELRAVVEGLRTPDVDRDGLLPAIRSLADLLSRVHHIDIEVVADGEPRPWRDAPSTRCSASSRRPSPTRSGIPEPAKVTVSVANGDGLAVTIRDDGQGFEPDARPESRPTSRPHFDAGACLGHRGPI